jgi:hypothetical protein
MSDKKISQLNELLTADIGDLIPIVDVSTNETKFIQKQNLTEIPSQTVTNGVTTKSPSEDAVFDAIEIAKGFVKDAVNKIAGQTLEVDKINLVNIGTDTTFTLPSASLAYKGKVLIVKLDNNPNFNLTISGAAHGTVILTKFRDSAIFSCVDTNESGDYFWFDVSQSLDISTKLDLDGGNANQDIDIDGFGLNAKHFKVNGTHGAGHIGLKHQSANISASASESSIGADSVGDPVWKNDGGPIDKLELQSNKTGTVTGNEASTSKYLTVKGVYDWAVALFAPKASPTFTGTITTPDIIVSGATASTPTFFDATKKLISTTAQLWGTWVQTWANKATPVDADTIGFYNSASTFVGVKSTLLNFWTAYLLPKIQALSYISGSVSNGFIPYFNGSSLVNSRIRHNYFTNGTYVAGTADVGVTQAFTVLNDTESITLFSAANSGLSTQMQCKDFAIRNEQNTGYRVSISPNGTGNFGYQLFLFTQAAYNQNPLGVYNEPNDVYVFRILSSGEIRNQAVNSTASTIISTFRKKDNTIVVTVQNDGLYVGSGTKSASASLQSDSTTQGFLPPRMTNTQRTNIVSPAIGLMVYCTDSIEGLYIYKSTGWTFII